MKTNLKKLLSVLLICCLFGGIVILGACAGKRSADQETAADVTNAAEEVNEDEKETADEEETADAQEEAEVPEDVTVDAETAEEIGKVVDAFAKAINDADWETVAALCVNGDATVEDLQKYNVTAFEADLDTLTESFVVEGRYACTVSYEFEYNGLDKKDLSLGNGLVIVETADGYRVETFCATGG